MEWFSELRVNIIVTLATNDDCCFLYLPVMSYSLNWAMCVRDITQLTSTLISWHTSARLALDLAYNVCVFVSCDERQTQFCDEIHPRSISAPSSRMTLKYIYIYIFGKQCHTPYVSTDSMVLSMLGISIQSDWVALMNNHNIIRDNRRQKDIAAAAAPASANVECSVVGR